MSSFTQSSYTAKYTGGSRTQAAVGAMKTAGRGFDSTKGLSAMLLAAMVSSLVVVADQLIDTWADGHLMLAWVALWVVAFAAVAVFASSARRLSTSVIGSLDAWSARVAKARADERLWVIAKTDARVMADLTAAVGQSER